MQSSYVDRSRVFDLGKKGMAEYSTSAGTLKGGGEVHLLEAVNVHSFRPPGTVSTIIIINFFGLKLTLLMPCLEFC